MTEERKKYIKEWKNKNKDRCREHWKRWYDSGGKEVLRKKREEDKSYIEVIKKSNKKYPEKIQARGKLKYAVKCGRVKRKLCQECGELKSQAHHHDYTKPLDVIWLCSEHHAKAHLSLKESISTVKP